MAEEEIGAVSKRALSFWMRATSASVVVLLLVATCIAVCQLWRTSGDETRNVREALATIQDIDRRLAGVAPAAIAGAASAEAAQTSAQVIEQIRAGAERRRALVEEALDVETQREHATPLQYGLIGALGAALLLTLAKGFVVPAAAARNAPLGRQQLTEAFKGSSVVMFSQDSQLRYTWASAQCAGHAPESMVGKCDEELFDAESYAPAIRAKRAALETGLSQRVLFSFVDDGALRRIDLRVTPTPQVDGGVGVFGAALDITERRSVGESRALLMRELTHRTQNILAVVLSLARQSARRQIDVNTYLKRLRDRLTALSAAYHLAMRSSFAGVPFDDLVRTQLLSAEPLIGSRIDLDGPAVLLRADAAQNLGLALFELGCNASQHGALSGAHGRLSIAWRLEPKTFVLSWQESVQARDAEAPVAPGEPGFGSLMITRLAPRALRGEATLDHAVTGTRFELRAPVETLLAHGAGQGAATRGTSSA